MDSTLRNEPRLKGDAIPGVHQKRPRTHLAGETLRKAHERRMERAGVDAKPESAHVMVYKHVNARPSHFVGLHAKDDLQTTPVWPAGQHIVAVARCNGSSSAYNLAAVE